MKTLNRIICGLALLGVLAVTGCGGGGDTSYVVTWGGQQPVAFTTVEQGAQAGDINSPITVPTVYKIKSNVEWNAFFASIPPEDSVAVAIPIMPPIDFNTHEYIAVLDGPKTTNYHYVFITDIYQTKSEVVVNALVRSPSSECPVHQLVCQPVCIVKVPIINKPVVLSLTYDQKCSSRL